MSKRKIMMKPSELIEIGDAMGWCEREHVNGSLEWYKQQLMFMVKNGRVRASDIDFYIGVGPWTREVEEIREDDRR